MFSTQKISVYVEKALICLDVRVEGGDWILLQSLLKKREYKH
jgi:hypothetical protein